MPSIFSRALTRYRQYSPSASKTKEEPTRLQQQPYRRRFNPHHSRGCDHPPASHDAAMGLVTTPVAPDEDEEVGGGGGAVASSSAGAPTRDPRAKEDAGEDSSYDVDWSRHRNGATGGNGRTSRFNSLTSNADSVVSGACSSVGSSVTPSEGYSSDVTGLYRGAPGLGAADPASSRTGRMSRRRTTVSRQSSFNKRIVFVPKPREMPATRLAFFTEIFRLKGTIFLKVVPQIVCAALMGLFANIVKLAYCGKDVGSNEVGARRRAWGAGQRVLPFFFFFFFCHGVSTVVFPLERRSNLHYVCSRTSHEYC